METPPAAPGVGAQTLALAVAAAAAAACSVEEKAKRARKRSRYLDDYEIPTLLNGLHHHHHHHHCIVTPPPPPRKGAALLLQLQQANVAAPDLLAALHRCAASPYEPPGPGGVDAGALLGFFALHRASVLATTGCGKDTAVSSTDHHRSSKDDAAAAAARLNPCRAMAVSNGSAGKEQADAIAMGHAAYAQAHHIGVEPANAAAPPGAAGPSKRKKKVTFALGAPSAAGCSVQPPTHGGGALKKAKKKAMAFTLGAPSTTSASAQVAATHSSGIGGAGSTPKKAAKNKKAVDSPKQGQHFGKPVALILQFAQGAADQPLPSKEQLHSKFRGFGPLIEPNTEITKKQARIVFQSSAAAEAAYSCVHTLGAFAMARLQYLRPPPPAPKIPLTDVRKNLEKMIASLTGPSLLGKDSAWNLAGEMQHLLVKVDRALNAGAGPSTSAAAHHY